MIADGARDRVDVLFLQYAARGILRRIQDDELGALVDHCCELIDIEPEIQFLTQMDRHSFRPHVIDHRFVDRESGIRIDDLIAVFAEREDGKKDDWFTTGDNDHFVRHNMHAARVAYMLRNDFAQLHQTGRRPVMREALMQSVRTRVNDVARRIKIGFADLEVNDVAPLRLQRFRFHKHFECSLGAKPRHALGETEFVRLSHHAKSTPKAFGVNIHSALAQLVFLATSVFRA